MQITVNIVADSAAEVRAALLELAAVVAARFTATVESVTELDSGPAPSVPDAPPEAAEQPVKRGRGRPKKDAAAAPAPAVVEPEPEPEQTEEPEDDEQDEPAGAVDDLFGDKDDEDEEWDDMIEGYAPTVDGLKAALKAYVDAFTYDVAVANMQGLVGAPKLSAVAPENIPAAIRKLVGAVQSGKPKGA